MLSTHQKQSKLKKSFYQPKSVWDLVREKLPVSISLGLWTFLLSYLISVPLGIAKAVRAGTRFDTLSSLVVLVGYAIPGFVLGVALLVIFGGQLQWFPLRGLTSSEWDQMGWGARIVDYLWHITLPVTASVLGAFAVTTMLTKNAFLEEIRKQYVVTARAKGLSEVTVLFRHVLRNALIPILTGVVVLLPLLFTGSLLTESFFAIPGLGSYTIDAINQQDFAIVRSMVFLGSVLYMLGLLLTDIAYTLVVPRVHLQ